MKGCHYFETILPKICECPQFSSPVLKTLRQPDPPPAETQPVFHAVGNSEPSYTEYVTDYLPAEVWMSGQDGFLIHVTKGAHSRQVVKGQKAGK